jgi:ABC-type transport system involved in multi-copper enzyme maturation permease subunit
MLDTAAAAMRLARRQITTRGRWLVALGVVAIPAVLAVIARHRTPDNISEPYGLLVTLMIAGILVPYLGAYLGSALVGDEIEGRTLVYLWTRPVGRHTVFLLEYVFVVLWLALVVAAAVGAVFVVLFWGQGVQGLSSNVRMAVWDTAAIAAGGAAYAALALLLSTLVRHPLTLMIVYIAADNMVQFVPGFMKLFFVRHHVMTLSSNPMADAPRGFFRFLAENQTTDGVARLTLACVVAVALLAAAWVLNRREYARG